jgi:prolyl 4-hydroxylase
MIETDDYMTNRVMTSDYPEDYTPVRKNCQNKHELCSIWAVEGLCDPTNEHYDFMKLQCAPACQTCELIDISVRCPVPEDAVDAIDPSGGDNGLNAIFERIVGERDITEVQQNEGFEHLTYKTVVHSRPSYDSDHDTAPWVVALENFLTPEECDRLIELGEEHGYERSTEVSDDEEHEDFISERRTSETAWCGGKCGEDSIVMRIHEKIALATGVPFVNSEYLQLLRYEAGHFYEPHHDLINHQMKTPTGPRLVTVFLYLNDVEEGGKTRFTKLMNYGKQLEIQPKKGTALLWPNVMDGNVYEVDPRTEHEALVVEKGTKYGANAWLHLREYEVCE